MVFGMFIRGYHGKFPPAPRSLRSWAAMRSGTGATLPGGFPGCEWGKGHRMWIYWGEVFFCWMRILFGQHIWWFCVILGFESVWIYQRRGFFDFQIAILIDGDVILIGIQWPFLSNFQVGAGQVLRWHGAGGSEKFQLKQGVWPFWKIGRFEYMDYLGGTFQWIKWLAYAKFFHGPMDDQKNQGTPGYPRLRQHMVKHPFFKDEDVTTIGVIKHEIHDEKQSTRKGIWVILSIPCGYSKFFFHQWCGLVSWQ